MENEKKFEAEKYKLTGEYGDSAMKRRVADAVKNVARLEKLGLSRRITVIVSARQYGVSVEKLAEMFNNK